MEKVLSKVELDSEELEIVIETMIETGDINAEIRGNVLVFKKKSLVETRN